MKHAVVVTLLFYSDLEPKLAHDYILGHTINLVDEFFDGDKVATFKNGIARHASVMDNKNAVLKG